MSKFRLSATVLILCTASISRTQAFNLGIHQLIINSSEALQPIIIQDTLILSYASFNSVQSVSAAFAHENYKKLHTYKRNSNNVFFLTIPLMENLEKLDYRIIVDGIWTTDPLAEKQKDRNGIMVSTFPLPGPHYKLRPGVEKLGKGIIQFVFQGSPGSTVSLVGDFNKWDPYLTPMSESLASPGIFAVRLNMAGGEVHYKYVVNGLSIPDPANPYQTVNGWGELVSVIK